MQEGSAHWAVWGGHSGQGGWQKARRCVHPGSNWRPFACEANVITNYTMDAARTNTNSTTWTLAGGWLAGGALARYGPAALPWPRAPRLRRLCTRCGGWSWQGVRTGAGVSVRLLHCHAHACACGLPPALTACG
jgi:hypothetical protein